MQKNIIAIHNILIKEKNCRTKFSTTSILKKINKNNFKKTQKQKYLSNTQIIKIFFPRLQVMNNSSPALS